MTDHALSEQLEQLGHVGLAVLHKKIDLLEHCVLVFD
jgi:hypothetical protein